MSQITSSGYRPLLLLTTLLLAACGVEEPVSIDSAPAQRDISLNISLNSASVLFSEDFDALSVGESPPQWNSFLGYQYNGSNTKGQSNYAIVDDSTAYSGNRSLHFHGGQTQLMRPLPAGKNQLVHLRAYVKLSKTMGNIQDYQFEYMMGMRGDVSTNNEIRFGHLMGTLGTSYSPEGNLSPTSDKWYSGKQLQPGTWYCIEAAVNANASYDEARLWIDGELVNEVTSDSDWNNTGAGKNWSEGKRNHVVFGFHNFGNFSTDLWMDDIVVANDRIGCDNISAPPVEPEEEPDSATGETLYSANCTGCHGDKGTGNVKIDPGKSAYGDNNQALADFIHDNMPANDPSKCTGNCAKHIAAYIKTWPQTSPVVEPDPATGESLYSANCAGCHGDKGTGSVKIDPSKSTFGDNNQVLEDFIHDNMPKGNATACVDDCAKHIAAYIRTWESTEPTPVDDPDPVNGESLYNSNCSGCHGTQGTGSVSIDPSKSAYGDNQTLAQFINDNMPKGNTSACTGQCAEDIAAYIRTWKVDSEPLTCEVAYGPRMIRILTKNEFANSLEDLTGVNIASDLSQAIYDAIPADNMLNGYSNNVLAKIDNGALQSYQLVVDAVVNKLADNSFNTVVDCSSVNNDTCAARFVDNYLPRVFRRPLSSDEKSTYNGVFSADLTGGDINEGLALALKAAFTSPQFLYRDETGVAVGEQNTGSNSGDGEYQQSGTVQTLIDTNDPKTINIYNQQGSNADFTGNDLVVVTVRGVKSDANGLWPTMKIESGGTVIARTEINHSDAKSYQFQVSGITGNTWIAIANTGVGASNEYLGGQNLIVSKWQISGAQGDSQPTPTPEPDVNLDDDAYVLTPYQLAAYLAFTFTGSTPDEQLLNAAGAGELATDSQVAAQVERLLRTDRARQHFGNFAAQWLRTDRVLDMVKDSEIYPTFSDEVRQAMAQEVRDVFTHVVLDEGEPFTSLFDGNYTFANKALADFYGIGGVSGNNMEKVTGLVSRAGLVTSGAFLTAHAHENETAPILRAVYLRKRMMCHNVPAPPTGVSLGGDDFDQIREEARVEWEAYLAENGGLATTRRKYEFQTTATVCMECHKEMINPLGGGFEDFNAVGLPQTQDYNGLTINAAGTMFGVSDIDDGRSFTFTGAKELAHAIAELDATRQCFVDNAFRLAMGTGSKLLDPAVGIALSAEEIGNYSCEVNKLDQVMTSNGNSTVELLKALGTLDSVRYRKDINRQ